MSHTFKTWAVLPVKRFAAAKTRLAPVLDAGERAALARLMFQDVLDCLLRCAGSLAGVVVTTSDQDASAMAEARGARLAVDPGAGGINGAIAAAVRTLPEQDGIMIVPSDIPQVTPHTIIAAAEAMAAPDTIVLAAAASDGGTNLLAGRPAAAVPLCFGARSFERHSRAARKSGLAVELLHSPDLALDIDRPGDLAAFLKLGSNTRTHAFLAKLAIERRMQGHTHPSGELDLVGAAHER